MFINNLEEIQTLKEGEKYSFKCLICGKESIRTNYKNRTAFLTCKGECTSIFKGVKILIEEPLEITTDTDLEEIKKKYKCNQRVEFKCQKCGCKENIQIRVLDKLLCSKCSFEETCLKKFGTTSPLSNKEIQKQIKQTNLKKYGVENIFQSKKIVEKAKQTKIEKYGDENYSNKEQTKQTMLERYGGYTLQSKELLEKVFCFEKNKIYNSFKEAASDNGLKSSCRIQRACKDFNKISAGCHWCLQEDIERLKEYMNENSKNNGK